MEQTNNNCEICRRQKIIEEFAASTDSAALCRHYNAKDVRKQVRRRRQSKAFEIAEFWSCSLLFSLLAGWNVDKKGFMFILVRHHSSASTFTLDEIQLALLNIHLLSCSMFRISFISHSPFDHENCFDASNPRMNFIILIGLKIYMQTCFNSLLPPFSVHSSFCLQTLMNSLSTYITMFIIRKQAKSWVEIILQYDEWNECKLKKIYKWIH